jgi:hypothetical protein
MPEINEPAAPMPRWTAEERGLWLDLLQAYSVALLPESDETIINTRKKEEQALDAVTLGARLADRALGEFQFRLFGQEESANPDEPDQSFEQFTQWLARRRAQRRNRRTKR